MQIELTSPHANPAAQLDFAPAGANQAAKSAQGRANGSLFKNTFLVLSISYSGSGPHRQITPAIRNGGLTVAAAAPMVAIRYPPRRFGMHKVFADRRLCADFQLTGESMKLPFRLGGIAVAAVALGIGLVGCGSETKGEVTTS
jgi:hypothetical protein